MSAYAALAPYYDSLMPQEAYRLWAGCCDELFRPLGVRTVLDLGCGTGTLAWLLAERGYEVLGVDSSCEMLALAQAKAAAYPQTAAPLFLQQPMQALDLYGTVQAAVCSMDGLNYLPERALRQALRRVSLFLEPGGLFLFDVHSPLHFRKIDKQTYVDEAEDVFCVWQVNSPDGKRFDYEMDIFTREGKHWQRAFERHAEYLHTPARLQALLAAAGFAEARVFAGLPLRPAGEDAERLFFLCRAAEAQPGENK